MGDPVALSNQGFQLRKFQHEGHLLHGPGKEGVKVGADGCVAAHGARYMVNHNGIIGGVGPLSEGVAEREVLLVLWGDGGGEGGKGGEGNQGKRSLCGSVTRQHLPRL